jgi:hypothetical protein
VKFPARPRTRILRTDNIACCLLAAHLLIAMLPLVGVAILVVAAIFLICLAVKISN